MSEKQTYIKNLYERDRVLIFTDDNYRIKGIMAYFITDNIEQFKREDIWSMPDEDENGRFIYIDKLITDKNSNLRSNFLDTMKYLQSKYPGKKIIWHSRRRVNICQIDN